MIVGSLVQGKVVLFPLEQSFSFVGQITGIVLSADSDNRVSVQISLLNDAARVRVQIDLRFASE